MISPSKIAYKVLKVGFAPLFWRHKSLLRANIPPLTFHRQKRGLNPSKMMVRLLRNPWFFNGSKWPIDILDLVKCSRGGPWGHPYNRAYQVVKMTTWKTDWKVGWDFGAHPRIKTYVILWGGTKCPPYNYSSFSPIGRRKASAISCTPRRNP